MKKNLLRIISDLISSLITGLLITGLLITMSCEDDTPYGYNILVPRGERYKEIIQHQLRTIYCIVVGNGCYKQDRESFRKTINKQSKKVRFRVHIEDLHTFMCSLVKKHLSEKRCEKYEKFMKIFLNNPAIIIFFVSEPKPDGSYTDISDYETITAELRYSNQDYYSKRWDKILNKVIFPSLVKNAADE